MKTVPTEKLVRAVKAVGKDFDMYIKDLIDEANVQLQSAPDMNTVQRLQGRVQILKLMNKNLNPENENANERY